MNDRKAMICRLKELNYSNTFCALDTVVRIEDDEKKLFDCRYCVFKDVVEMLVCPNEIKEDIEDVLKLR